jgi:hypothetical protein
VARTPGPTTEHDNDSARAFGLRPGGCLFNLAQTDSHWEVSLMARSFRSWCRAVVGATPAQRRSFVPRVFLFEDRTLPSV